MGNPVSLHNRVSLAETKATPANKTQKDQQAG
jgi:hypothetical protein